MNNCTKPVVLITFTENGDNGGPNNSHRNIIRSKLGKLYNFVPLIVPRARTLLSKKGFSNFCNTIINSKPDFVHFSGLQLEGYFVSKACKKLGIPSLMTIRGSSRDALNISFIKKMVLCYFEKKALNFCTFFYSNSVYVSNWRFLRKYKNKSLGCIYNLCSYSNRTSSLLDIKKMYGVPENGYLFVSTGRIIKDKGYDVLVNACCSICKENNDFYLLVVGDGDYKVEMEKIVAKNKLEKHFIFVGYQRNVFDYLVCCDAYISLTLHETLGNSIIEACSASLPVIASNVGGIPEIVNKETGILVDPYNMEQIIDSINWLMENRDKGIIMGLNGASTVMKRFGEESVCPNIDKAYRIILNKK